MTDRRIYDDELYAHFVTFSCYKRRNLLGPDRAKRIVIGTLGTRLTKHDAKCIGFVVMPDHVHAMIWFDRPNQLSMFMNKWKDQSSAQVKRMFQRTFPSYWSKVGGDDAVWQARYYPFHVYSEKKLREKLDYMHMNPVTRGLVERACNWPWSSARSYLEGKSVGVPISMPEI